MVELAQGVLDGELVEVEDVVSTRASSGVGWSRSTHTHTPLSGLSQAGSTASTQLVDPF